MLDPRPGTRLGGPRTWQTYLLPTYLIFVHTRMEAIRNGEATPIMDRIVFKKIRALLGGYMRLMLCGGAPLSKEVHDFMRICIGAHLLQVSFSMNNA